MSDILFSLLSFILGALAANLYRRAVANDTADVLADVSQEMADLMADVVAQRGQNARLQAELDELRRGLDALGRVDLGG